jgi:hypothetical protein
MSREQTADLRRSFPQRLGVGSFSLLFVVLGFALGLFRIQLSPHLATQLSWGPFGMDTGQGAMGFSSMVLAYWIGSIRRNTNDLFARSSSKVAGVYLVLVAILNVLGSLIVAIHALIK